LKSAFANSWAQQPTSPIPIHLLYDSWPDKRQTVALRDYFPERVEVKSQKIILLVVSLAVAGAML